MLHLRIRVGCEVKNVSEGSSRRQRARKDHARCARDTSLTFAPMPRAIRRPVRRVCSLFLARAVFCAQISRVRVPLRVHPIIDHAAGSCSRAHGARDGARALAPQSDSV